jgi:hypothetical protein
VEDEMGGVCSTNRRKEEPIGYWRESQRERDRWEDKGIGGRIILRWILERWNGGGVDWIGMAQDRNLWRPLVILVLNLRVP